MGLAEDIRNTIADYLEGDYEVVDSTVIPSVEDLPFGKVARRMNVCVFYTDLRNSTGLLFVHQKQTAGKLHKSFLYAISAVVRHFGGQIRSFNGDSLMALWPGRYKRDLTACVRAALAAKWLLDVELSALFEKYEKLDFGIGVDFGEVLIARAGLPRDANNNDLIFMGPCVNYAVAIGEQACAPYHVEISKQTYENLDDAAIYGTTNGQRVDIWQPGSVAWKGQSHPTRLTSWYLPL